MLNPSYDGLYKKPPPEGLYNHKNKNNYSTYTYTESSVMI